MSKSRNNIKVGSPAWLRQTFPSSESIVSTIFKCRVSKDKNRRCPRCSAGVEVFRPVTGRRAMQCSNCGWQVSPLAGTPWANIKFNLVEFTEMAFEIITNSHLISSNQLRKRYTLNYKTAYLVALKVHELMALTQKDIELEGVVHIDETSLTAGNMGMDRYYPWRSGTGCEKHIDIFGMVEAPKKVIGKRSTHGRIIFFRVPNREEETLLPLILKHLNPQKVTMIISDQLSSYNKLHQTYNHKTVNHEQWEWKTADGYSNGAIEGAWSQLKNSISRICSLSEVQMLRYLNAHAFIHNHRHLSNDEKLQCLFNALPPLLDTYQTQS